MLGIGGAFVSTLTGPPQIGPLFWGVSSSEELCLISSCCACAHHHVRSSAHTHMIQFPCKGFFLGRERCSHTLAILEPRLLSHTSLAQQFTQIW